MDNFDYIGFLRNNPLKNLFPKQPLNESKQPTTEGSMMDIPSEKSSKMKKSELKNKIREQILSTLKEEEDYERMGREVEFGVGPDNMEDELSDEELFGGYEDEEFEDIPLDEQEDEDEETPSEEEMDDEVEADVEADTDMEAGADSSTGLTPEEQDIQNNLKVAYDNAVAIGDQKLADQIGNSITFFTRTHVVER